MSHSLIALLVFIVTGLGLTVWLRQQAAQRSVPQAPTRSAEQLGKLRWREFAKLLLQVMHARGYSPAVEDGLPADGIPTDGSDILLVRGDQRALLSCKYGTSAVVDANALLALPQSAKLRGCDFIIVVTPGRFEKDALKFAREQKNIELIDGEDLWPEVRPYVPEPEAPPQAPAETAPTISQRKLGMVWGGAAIAGILVWLIAAMGTPDTASPTADIPPPSVPQPTAQAAASTAAAAPAAAAAFPTEEEAETHRREAANAITTLFGVSRAMWSTQSTLLVYLSSDTVDPLNDICPLLERYPELASSRIQLQPPAGSTKPVRFKQCRTY